MKNLIYLFFCLYPITIFAQCFGTKSTSNIVLTDDWQLSTKDAGLFELVANSFGVHPVTFYFDDSNQPKGNAFATNFNINYKNFEAYGTSKYGYVGIGKKLMEKLRSKKTKDGKKDFHQFAIWYIYAHELAHTIQYFGNYDIPDLSPEIAELNADYTAGIFIAQMMERIKATFMKNGKDKLDKASHFMQYITLEKDILDLVADTALEFGDTSYFDKNHHGTSAQRMKAFYDGYEDYMNNTSKDKFFVGKIALTDLVNRIHKHKKEEELWLKN